MISRSSLDDRLTSPGAAIVDLQGEPDAGEGVDRRRTVALAFALCLAVGSAFLGRDGPVEPIPGGGSSLETTTRFVYDRSGAVMQRTLANDFLSLPANTTDVQLEMFPDWLANEQLPPMQYVPVRVRSAYGLAVEAVRPGDQRILTWTERGTVYWLISDRRDVADLVRLADSLH